MNKKRIFIFSGIGVIVIVAIAAVLFYVLKPFQPQEKVTQDPLMPFVHADMKIGPALFEAFLRNLSAERRILVMKSLKENFEGVPGEDEIKKALLWEASHWLIYLTIDKKFVEYHKIVQEVAKKMEIEKSTIETGTTFQLERLIIEKAFANTWDQLTPEQRMKVLKEFDKGNQIANTVGIAALSRASAHGVLATIISLTGFSFYTTTTSLLASTAGVIGVTLPFGVYATTSSAIAALGGPIGWTIAGISAVTGAALLGTPDVVQTAKAIIQIHMIKVEAMHNSGVDIAPYLSPRS